MKIDKELIEKVAKLARLELTSEEKTQLENDFRDILAHFAAIDECDTDGVEPALHPVPLAGELREDIASNSLSQEQALCLSRSNKDGYFKGPRSL